MSTYSALLTLDVDARRSRQGIVTVRSHMHFPAICKPVLRTAKWLPAFHAPRGPLKFMAGFRFVSGEDALAWTRDPEDPFRFVIETGAPIDTITCSHDFVGPTDHDQGRVLMAEAILRLQWAGLCLYPEHVEQSGIGVAASVRLPEGWTAASALEIESREGEVIRYAACGLTDFFDSPVLAGAHYRHAPLAEGVDLEIFADEPGQLPQVADHLDCHAKLIAEADALFGKRPFRHYTFLLALSDQLGRMGLEHRGSSENGVRGDYFSDWDNSPTERDLLPHEYVHSWIGKYRVPAGNLTRDFASRMNNELLWVYEGLTQYYGHVLAARCGLVTKEQTLGAFALIAATYDRRPGRSWRALADTVHDPVFVSRDPLPWKSWQRSEDYYSEGLLIWLEVDMTIRRLSSNSRSLDDFARWFFGPSCPTEMASAYDRKALIEDLHGLQAFDWDTFFAARVDAIMPDAPLDGLKLAGYRLGWSIDPNEWHRCDQHHHSYCDLTFSIGLKIGLANKVLEVIWGSPAFKAELAVGAVLTKVGKEQYSHSLLVEAVARSVTAEDPIQISVRQHGVERDVVLDWSKGHRYPVAEALVRQPTFLDILHPRRPTS